MNKIFNFLDYNVLYDRCIMASVAHAIMVGKYNLLASEQSWDGMNYNFQNMEGVRGVISFGRGYYICAIQNSMDFGLCNEQDSVELLSGAEEKIIELAKEEALQYMLIECNEKSVSSISTAFWGSKSDSYSNQSEETIINISENLIMPYLYSENDAKKYWKNYYEMTDEQLEMMENIYARKIGTKGRVCLASEEVSKLEDWFGNIDECVESFEEMGICLLD